MKRVPAKFRIQPQPPTFFTSPRDRQSRRTTFRLTQAAMTAKAWLAGHWGISQKDVLDYIAEAVLHWDGRTFEDFRFAEFYNSAGEEAVRRTHVISRGALRVIEKKASDFGVSRDDVTDLLLRVLGFGARSDARKVLERREKAQEQIDHFLKQAHELLRELAASLGDEDPVVQRVGVITILIENLYSAITSEQVDGTPINPVDIHQSR